MDLRIGEKDGASIFVLKGPLTIESAGELKAVLADAINKSDIVIDLSGAKEADISCLQLLCSAHRSAAGSGRKISISACSGLFRQAAKEAGLFPNVCRKNLSDECLWAGKSNCGDVPNE